eukprot:2636495-Prorocentrum_lima.AAC.1
MYSCDGDAYLQLLFQNGAVLWEKLGSANAESDPADLKGTVLRTKTRPISGLHLAQSSSDRSRFS